MVTLQKGMDVASGDTIITNRSGVVQLVFADETKIAVGPNARMVLDVTMLRGNRKAKSFAVQALGGSFRFISGNSRKRAYSIRTPTATMAVRGTTFDIWVPSGAQSAMLVLDGEVRMCSLRGGCRHGDQRCGMLATGTGGRVGRPLNASQYDKAVQSGFPFVQSQQRLLPPFKVNVGGCSGAEALALPVRAETVERDAPETRAEGDRAEPSEQPAERTASDRPAPSRPDSTTGASASASAGSSTQAQASAGSVSVSVDLSDDGPGGSGTSASASAGGISVEADTR